MKKSLLFLLVLFSLIKVHGQSDPYQPEFSTAGFFQLEGTGRDVYSMNPAWRFHKGAILHAETVDFNDSSWDVVSLPNGLEYIPTEASGCVNYQGEAWYRKHFSPGEELKDKKLFLHFEAIMGKSKIYINGKMKSEHFGGYLPIVIDITDDLKWGQDNVIAVWTDNSNDPNYPPGKDQEVLDFTYFGGIYRDCWLIAHNHTYITDPNYEDVVAGGGLFVAYDNVSEKSADILLKTHIRNEHDKSFKGELEYELIQPDGESVALVKEKISVRNGKTNVSNSQFTVKRPMLWSPEHPYLYNLLVRIRDNKGNIVDGYRQRIGIRSIEFKGEDGFWLNGKPYEGSVIGANRHQDFAIIGNAVPNSLHWRDAKKLRDVGLKAIRNAHCPQDPAFMDACDELGLLVIVNTPGWQFWNNAPIFAQHVFDDIRNLVRRDRNHACIWMWEPILNETWYPADFAARTQEIVKEEYPYPYCYSACDSNARGAEAYTDIQFSHPNITARGKHETNLNPGTSYFTREWGDYVDNWNSHNSPSRVARQWGEVPMLVQAQHYAVPEVSFTCYDVLFRTSRQHIGGCLWHSFDHQRGYHPDPFYGGLMDVFRQPKYSYYMFMAQRSSERQEDVLFETGPMVYIANEMTPFSPHDVTIYSNCDEVRLTIGTDGNNIMTYIKPTDIKGGMPSPIITFKDAFRFASDIRRGNQQSEGEKFALLRAEGLIDGRVVCTHEVRPARRPAKLSLRIDDENTALHADGSDIVTVVAEVTDEYGNVKHLNNYSVKFEVEGEGQLIGGPEILSNPVPVKWGAAPILVRATLKPGAIKVKASVLFTGSQMPIASELTLQSVAAENPMVYSPSEALLLGHEKNSFGSSISQISIEDELNQRAKNAQLLKEVEQQQTDFGEK